MLMLFRNEKNLPKERINCLVANCKMYHVISDKIVVMINSTIQNLENVAKHSICNYAIFCIQHADW